ncbi:MAG: hypothetical protein IJ165_08980 [Proteobacteria bacterium]|nr:hypothetical protein [Pseudomonadota bacterium]
MKRFLLLSLALLFFPCQAHADQIDCKITVDFNSQSVRSAAVSTSAANALAKALETSCKKICPSSNTNDADCLDACIKYSSLSATECFTSDNVYVEANREAGRKRLISMRSPAKKSKSNIHIANWYGSKSDLLAPRATSDSALLLKNDKKSSKRSNKRARSLLLDDSASRPLLFFPDRSESDPPKKADNKRPAKRNTGLLTP